MKALLDESRKRPAADDTSPIESKGYLDGELCRQRGGSPSAYEQVGLDEYARDFRAAYYERQTIYRTERSGGKAVAELHLAVSSRVSTAKNEGADRIEPFPNPA